MASKTVRTSAIVIGILLVALVSFSAGLAVGFHKARFSYAFGENYERNFVGGKFPDRDDRISMMRGGMMNSPDFEGRGFRNAHGISGEILSITDANIIIKGRDNAENTIAISEQTLIKSGPDSLSVNDLKTGLKVVVIGKPNDTGTINADFIRVFPDTAGIRGGWGNMMPFGNNQ